MKLLIQSAMIFFGTLMAAALVALGEPGKADEALAANASTSAQADHRSGHRAHARHAWVELASTKSAFDAR
jgi:hypothetical protein